MYLSSEKIRLENSKIWEKPEGDVAYEIEGGILLRYYAGYHGGTLRRAGS